MPENPCKCALDTLRDFAAKTGRVNYLYSQIRKCRRMTIVWRWSSWDSPAGVNFPDWGSDQLLVRLLAWGMPERIRHEE